MRRTVLPRPSPICLPRLPSWLAISLMALVMSLGLATSAPLGGATAHAETPPEPAAVLVADAVTDIVPVDPGTAKAGESVETTSEGVAPKREKDKENPFIPILLLLAVIAFVLWRLPKVDLGHSKAFMRRRVMNWLPLGLTYMFLYMARYNLTVAKTSLGDAMSVKDFSFIFAAGTITYGISFVINGPLTDRLGGKFAILTAGIGSSIMSLIMGLAVWQGWTTNGVVLFAVLYSINMYFQSFGAVAIVKINASWFHVKERGVFGAIFGILISLGIFMAFDVGGMIVSVLPTHWVFIIPGVLLAIFVLIDIVLVRNTPEDAGLEDFDTADASSGDDGPRLPVGVIFKKMLSNPIILTIAAVEFCSGFLRQAIMHYYRIFAKATEAEAVAGGWFDAFVIDNWGLVLCCAGILGGVFAGIVSDRVFGSRRGPVAVLFYGLMLIGSIVLIFALETPYVGWIAAVMSMAIIGVHGMLSGTASMDFGGKKNVGVAVGIIDGFVYLGTGTMAVVFGMILPETADQGQAANWDIWPIAMIPVAAIGFLFALRIWNAHPSNKAGGH